jgi:putative ABC transport system permease protein
MLMYVMKTLWRHSTRTTLTVLGSAVAMFVFCMVGAVQEGLDRLARGLDADRNLIVFQENRFCPTTSRLPEDYDRIIREVPGVSDVMPIQVWTNNCRASLDIVVFQGANPEQIRTSRPLRLLTGDWDRFASLPDAAIVGTNIAKRRRLAVGDQFSIGELSVRVVGVFESRVPSEENLIYTNLAFLQLARGQDGAGLVTQHEVALAPQADADRVATEIDARLRAQSIATKTRRKGAFQASTLSDLVDLIGFAHWLGYACVGLVLSLVATTTLMSVQDRFKEYAVLQTIGFRPLRTMRLVLLESLLLCLVGGSTGTLSALTMLALGGFAIGAEGATIAFEPTINLGATGLLVSALLGVLAGIAPALGVSRLSIVSALRQP